MPIVEVTLWQGITKENKQKIFDNFTKTLEELGVPKQDIDIVLYEVPKADWCTGGKPHN